MEYRSSKGKRVVVRCSPHGKVETDPKLAPVVQEMVDAMVTPETLQTDPMGSYTGSPRAPMEVPVQDADDL